MASITRIRRQNVFRGNYGPINRRANAVRNSIPISPDDVNKAESEDYRRNNVLQLYPIRSLKLANDHWLVKDSSLIHHFGVYAIKALKIGDLIGRYSGEYISRVESKRRINKNPNAEIYHFALKDGSVIVPDVNGNVLKFINHSCLPNIEAKEVKIRSHKRYRGRKKDFVKLEFRVIEDVAAGQEITLDYHIIRNTRKRYMSCNCGNGSRCRGYIDWIYENKDGE